MRAFSPAPVLSDPSLRILEQSPTVPVHSGIQSVTRHPAPILTGSISELTDVLVAPVLGGEGNHTRPTLKIQDGCNSRCSFCVIPSVRGKSRSLPPPTVISEIQRLAGAGFREVVLSGINLGTYGRDLSPRVEFLDLLRRIIDETSLECLRLSSIEPLDVTQDLIDLFASTSRLAPHFHMPLQSGSDRILAAMHRWYRAEHYSRRINSSVNGCRMPLSVPTLSPDFLAKPKRITPQLYASSKIVRSPISTSSPIPAAPAQRQIRSQPNSRSKSSRIVPGNFAPSANPNLRLFEILK